jgi:hypothetical protein
MVDREKPVTDHTDLNGDGPHIAVGEAINGDVNIYEIPAPRDESLRGDIERAHDQHDRPPPKEGGKPMWSPPPGPEPAMTIPAGPPPKLEDRPGGAVPLEGGALPTTWREAVPYVVWVVLVLGFGLELVAAFVRGEWAHFGVSLAGLVALMTAALHWKQAISWAKGLSPNLVVGTLAAVLCALALSPYVEQRRLPFEWQLSSLSSAPTPSPGFTQEQVNEKIATAIANLNSQLTETNRQKEVAIRDAEALRKQAQNAPPPPRPNYDEPRVFTTKTVTELRGFYKDRTALQGNAFMADEIGKWIRTEGTIQFIRPDGLVFLNDEGGIISCEFHASWNPKLSAFRPGETMKVVGKIGTVQIGATPIYLQPCEIRD